MTRILFRFSNPVRRSDWARGRCPTRKVPSLAPRGSWRWSRTAGGRRARKRAGAMAGSSELDRSELLNDGQALQQIEGPHQGWIVHQLRERIEDASGRIRERPFFFRILALATQANQFCF